MEIRNQNMFTTIITNNHQLLFQGFVIVSSDANNDRLRKHTYCHFINMTLRIYWSGFYDRESEIGGFRIAIGRSKYGTDVVPFKSVDVTDVAEFNDLGDRYGLSLGEILFVTVEAKNLADLSSRVTSLPTRLISEQQYNSDGDFKCINIQKFQNFCVQLVKTISKGFLFNDYTNDFF